MIIARTSGRSTSSIASGIARSIAWLIALRFSGRLSAIYAISPSTRTLIGFSAIADTSVAIELAAAAAPVAKLAPPATLGKPAEQATLGSVAIGKPPGL